MGELLRLVGLRSRYGPVTVLRGLDLAVAPGEVRLLVGRNGSGKSTALKAVAGLVPIEEGEIRLDGEAIEREPTRRRIGRGIALVPQADNRGRGVFPHLTVRENLDLTAPRRAPGAAYGRVWRLFPELERLARTRAASLSGGQQQMLAVGLALMTKPRLLMLDEPTCGVAPGRAIELMAAIRGLADQEGVAVLLVEQNVSLVLRFVDRVTALRSGQVAAEVPPQTLEDAAWLSRVL